MNNWDYTETEYKKQATADPKWHLERLINYGLRGEKIKKKLLERYLGNLKITDDARAFLETIVWNKKF